MFKCLCGGAVARYLRPLWTYVYLPLYSMYGRGICIDNDNATMLAAWENSPLFNFFLQVQAQVAISSRWLRFPMTYLCEGNGLAMKFYHLGIYHHHHHFCLFYKLLRCNVKRNISSKEKVEVSKYLWNWKIYFVLPAMLSLDLRQIVDQNYYLKLHRCSPGSQPGELSIRWQMKLAFHAVSSRIQTWNFQAPCPENSSS